MKKRYDVIVIGLGANGSAAAYHLSKTGLTVCGIDRFAPPHSYGSSHGQSRIIRQAYYENPLYVPLVQEAYRLWESVENESGKQLLLKTGGLMLGKENAAVITGSRLSAKAHHIPFDYLDNDQLSTRFPGLRPGADTVGILEKDAGILFPEACVQTFLDIAKKNGCSLQYNERVMKILPRTDAVEIITDKDVYEAGKLIVAPGAWLNELMPGLALPLVVERQVLYWFKYARQQTPEYFSPGRLPVYIWEYAPEKMFYGFPDLGDGIKIAYHHSGKTINPDELVNDVSAEEISGMASVAGEYFNLNPEFNYAVTCMYTNTPDQNFIIDLHPLYKNICVASPCSGHGFKFASLTGKLLCDLVLDHPVSFDLSPFSISRFSSTNKQISI